MKLSIGIVGLPNVGKSTLFKILTAQEINIANYPFATIDPNVGVVPVPDERVGRLAAMSVSKKTIPAVVEFYDIAGLIRNAAKGEGLGNQFLSHIREVSAIVEVVRCFKDAEIIHTETGVDPLRDIGIIHTELALKDLDTVEKRLAKSEGEARTGDRKKIEDHAALLKTFEALKAGTPALDLPSEVREHPAVKELQLLTAKPIIFLLNGTEQDVSDELKKELRARGAEYLVYDLGGAENVSILIRKAYEVLGLISFFTTGEDETRAWTIARGAKAPQAAGVIHSDFEKKFIRAETVTCEKLLFAGSWTAAKQKGWIRAEGKDYVVDDGDVMVFRHG